MGGAAAFCRSPVPVSPPLHEKNVSSYTNIGLIGGILFTALVVAALCLLIGGAEYMAMLGI